MTWQWHSELVWTLFYWIHLPFLQVEDRLKFYETGDLPKKNLEVMQEALEEVQKEASEFKTVEKKKKKKDKKVSNFKMCVSATLWKA